MVKSFVLGGILGGAAVWFYGDHIRRYIDERTETVRKSVVNRIDAVTGSLETVREKIDEGLAGSPAGTARARTDAARPAAGVE